jgi:hypothetical protein
MKKINTLFKTSSLERAHTRQTHAADISLSAAAAVTELLNARGTFMCVWTAEGQMLYGPRIYPDT